MMQQNPSIVSRVTGGLGNQMFQYAAAYALSRRLNSSLGVDTSCYDYTHESNRRYMLDCFAIAGGVITPGRISRFMYKMAGSERFPRVAGCTRSFLNLADVKEIREYHFDPISLPRARRIRLLGYWQSFRYFDEYETEIRSQFTPRNPPAGRNAAFLDQIRNTPGAVSVHIRRGDYLKVRPQAVLPLEYYRSAVQIILQKVPAPTFFLFSDDIAWARQNLPLPGETVVMGGNNELAGYEDMQLMSACRHHIIANSSFSWWAAWLNPSLRKVVIAPRYWMGTQASYHPGLFPPDWAVLPSTIA